jgi:hypothetical protein
MIASDSLWMAQLMAEKNLKPTWTQVIPAHNGKERFTVLIFKP